MRKKILYLLSILTIMVSILPVANIQAEGEKRELVVGMEAAYPPFNWSQDDDSNGAVKIEGANEYANGYDVQIAKAIADDLGMELKIEKIAWDGLLPALQSGKIDAIIAGMSPTEDRKLVIDFTAPYYESQLVLVTSVKSNYADGTTLADFEGARVVAQMGTFHDTVIDQIPGVIHEEPMGDFSVMRVAVESGKVDAYVAERPEGISAEIANSNFKMIDLEDGFEASAEDVQVAIGIAKGSDLAQPMNEALAKISAQDRQDIMDEMINVLNGVESQDGVWDIFTNNWQRFLRGTIMTVLLALVGTVIGLFIGFIVALIRTAPESQNFLLNAIMLVLKGISNIYIQVIRGTPMMVQAILFYYGTKQFFDIDISSMISAFIIISVNTGAYMAETVRAGINSIDKGQTEAAKALGMNHFQTMRYVILPQTFRNIIPNVGNEFIVNIKDSSVLNVIQVNELFFETRTIISNNLSMFETYLITSIIYLALTLSVTGLLRLLEQRLKGDDSYEKIEHDVLSSSN